MPKGDQREKRAGRAAEPQAERADERADEVPEQRRPDAGPDEHGRNDRDSRHDQDEHDDREAPMTADTGSAAAVSTRTATLRYTALRFAVFAGCFVVIAVLAYVGVVPESFGTANPLWLVMLSLVVSAPISLVLLRGQRDQMSQQLAPRVERAKAKLTANQGMEDDVA
ncbi:MULTISPECIES: DUF4229 domain-containing protein [Streptomyces]|nr:MULTISPECIES: DUF4229 domain-containing protein [Streptomyces]